MATVCDQSQVIVQTPTWEPMKSPVIVSALCLLIGELTLTAMPVHAAGWTSGFDAYAEPWIKGK